MISAPQGHQATPCDWLPAPGLCKHSQKYSPAQWMLTCAYTHPHVHHQYHQHNAAVAAPPTSAGDQQQRSPCSEDAPDQRPVLCRPPGPWLHAQAAVQLGGVRAQGRVGRLVLALSQPDGQQVQDSDPAGAATAAANRKSCQGLYEKQIEHSPTGTCCD